MSVDFAQVKADNPIEKVAELLGIEVTKQRNGQLRGCCPIHGGNDPRGFVITPAKGLWFCFKCDTGGDQLALISKLRKCSVQEAAEWLSVGGTVQETVPDRDTVPEPDSGFKELDGLDPEHQAVDAVGFEPEIAKALGIGYCGRGILRGTVAIPLRRADGKIAGYIGVTDITVIPPRWHLPTQKVVKLNPKRRAS